MDWIISDLTIYATHTFVPPTPGPIAAAGNLGLENNLGLVIMIGLGISIVPILCGWFWANRFINVQPDGGDKIAERLQSESEAAAEKRLAYGELPLPAMAFMPIIVPILLLCLGSIATFPSHPLGEGFLFQLLAFLGKPLNALLIGMLLSFLLFKGKEKGSRVSKAISEGLTVSAPILLITGAGGAFGAVLKATSIGEYLGQTLSGLGLGIFMPFVIAAAFKTAQGSSTVALVATSAMMSPLLATIGLDSEMGRVLCVMAIGAGAMTVSHANDSFFWVVSQFSRMSVAQAYRAQTIATALQGLGGMIVVWILSLVIL
ncbi:Inner membrane permease ygbN [Suttonella ornithocola]|uniref:Inner membrane permease ygbN n=1 Tax=Suttonella ornithocola TaxID=279832 RepID=A0A380MZ64_9GAMM|nr:GntP family permease [Suttonella ornithocola]SUO97193.1 Inner membrane permease ygbN [Suttonella ornithocola]